MTRQRPRFVFTGELECERTDAHRPTFTSTGGGLGFLECDCGLTFGAVREREWRDVVASRVAARAQRLQNLRDCGALSSPLPRVVPAEPPPVVQARRRGRPRTAQMIERDHRILALARSKVTGREIAEREGITEARVWQILRRMRSQVASTTTGSGVATSGDSSADCG